MPVENPVATGIVRAIPARQIRRAAANRHIPASENPDVSGISNHVDNQNLYRHLQKIRRFRRAGEQGGILEFRYRIVRHPVVLPGDRRIVTRRLPFRKRLFPGSARARRQSCRQTSA